MRGRLRSPGCEDCLALARIGFAILCGECGHLVVADAGAWTSDEVPR
jgi:hypothetical protein